MKAAAATPKCSSLLSLHCVEFISEVELVPEDEQGQKHRGAGLWSAPGSSKPQGPRRNIKWKLNHVSFGHPYPSSTSKIFEVKKMQCFKMQFWVIYSHSSKIQESMQVLNFLIHTFLPPTHCPPFLGVSFQKLFFSSLVFTEKGGIPQSTLLFLLIFGW